MNLLYSPTSGDVLLDGDDAKSPSLSSLREHITLGDPVPSFEKATAASPPRNDFTVARSFCAETRAILGLH